MLSITICITGNCFMRLHKSNQVNEGKNFFSNSRSFHRQNKLFDWNLFLNSWVYSHFKWQSLFLAGDNFLSLNKLLKWIFICTKVDIEFSQSHRFSPYLAIFKTLFLTNTQFMIMYGWWAEHQQCTYNLFKINLVW